MAVPPGPAPDRSAGQTREAELSWRLSGHARRRVTLALAGLVVAVITRRAEFAGLAAPALLLLAPWRPVGREPVTVTLVLDTEQLTEGEQATLAIRIDHRTTGGQAAAGPEWDARVRLRPAHAVTAGDAVPGGDGWFRIPFHVRQWGARDVGTAEITLYGRWQLSETTVVVPVPPVRCLPRAARLDSLVLLSKFPARLGEHPARAAGDGTEFAGVREFVPGDRQRRINWPATTRRGTIQLNTFAAERAQSVVILMDVSAAVGPPGASSADLAVRAALGTAARYLAARDRVGLISFGSRVRWLSPGAGQRQAHRILDLVMSGPEDGDPIDSVGRLPRAALPPGSLILVFSPLLSMLLVEALRGLRETGFTTIVVDVLAAEPQPSRGRYRRMSLLATRIWRMEQQAIRFSLRELGIPVVRWDGRSSLDEPLAPFTR
ncbi:MAG: DUF58 domain-containing protein, partial [Streptosporangiaceae bacterium]